MTWSEVEGGVLTSPVPVTSGEQVTIRYNGLLASSGADTVYLHVGYGPSYSWKNTKDIPMKRTPEGFEASFKAEANDRLNFCFKDSADNWDNNNGKDWSYTIHNGRQF